MNINKIPLLRPCLALVVSFFVLCGALWGPAMADDEPEGLMNVKLSKNPDPLDANVETSIDHLFEVLRTPRNTA